MMNSTTVNPLEALAGAVFIGVLLGAGIILAIHFLF